MSDFAIVLVIAIAALSFLTFIAFVMWDMEIGELIQALAQRVRVTVVERKRK